MSGRALVLGGGGVTGVARGIGLLAGLAELGVDLADADLVVGTSAGSVVGADVRSGISLAEFYATQLAPPDGEVSDRIRLRWVAMLTWNMVRSRDAARARARIGRMALAAKTISEEERRKVFTAALAVHEWPARRLLITAVDAESGEFRAFDAASGVNSGGRGRSQLRGAGNLAAGHHRRPALHRWRHALPGERRPGSRA